MGTLMELHLYVVSHCMACNVLDIYFILVTQQSLGCQSESDQI